MKTKRCLAVMLVMQLLCAMLCISVHAEELPSYPSASGLDFDKNAGAQWKMYYRASWETAYVPMQYSATESQTIQIGGKDIAPGKLFFMVGCSGHIDPNVYNSWQGDNMKDKNHPGSSFIAENLMATNSGYNNNYNVAKGFTAPQSGRVKITNVSSFGDSKIRRGGADEYGVALRIAKNNSSNVVWPADGTPQNLTKSGGFEYDFQPIYVDVNKGDVLYFNAESPDGQGNSFDFLSRCVEWNPVVTYTYLSEKTTQYVAGSMIEWSPGENDNPVWAAYWGEDGGDYRRFTNEHPSGGQSIPGLNGGQVASDGFMKDASWGYADGDMTHGSPFVSMRGMAPGGSGNDKSNRYRVAKGFTAPASGRVQIVSGVSKGYLGTNRVQVGTYECTGADGLNIWIADNTADNIVWPFSGEKQLLNANCQYATQDNYKGLFPIAPFELDVKKGHTYYFTAQAATHNTPAYKVGIDWAPTVNYLSFDPIASTEVSVDGAKVENYDITQLDGHESCEVKTIIDGTAATMTMIAAAYDVDDRLICAGVCAEGTEDDPGVPARVFKTTLNYGQTEVNKVKVFMFDSMQGLKPIKLEGLETDLLERYY